jgi:hypothetical protein
MARHGSDTSRLKETTRLLLPGRSGRCVPIYAWRRSGRRAALNPISKEQALRAALEGVWYTPATRGGEVGVVVRNQGVSAKQHRLLKTDEPSTECIPDAIELPCLRGTRAGLTVWLAEMAELSRARRVNAQVFCPVTFRCGCRIGSCR